MVIALLDLRYNHFKAKFERHNSSAQLSMHWEKLLLKINNLTASSVSNVLSLKNKLNSLIQKYNEIRKQESLRTGNATEDPIDYPVYWSEMVSVFGDKTGIGNIEYGSESPSNIHASIARSSEEETKSSDDEGSALKRKLEVQAVIDLQRKNGARTKTINKISIPD